MDGEAGRVLAQSQMILDHEAVSVARIADATTTMAIPASGMHRDNGMFFKLV